MDTDSKNNEIGSSNGLNSASNPPLDSNSINAQVPTPASGLDTPISTPEQAQPIQSSSVNPMSSPVVSPVNTPINNPAQPAVSAQPTNTQPSVNMQPPVDTKINFLAFLIAFFRKPVTTLNQELDKFSNFKNAGFIAGLVALISTIGTLLYTIFLTVYRKDCGYFSFSKKDCKAEWKWDNLKNAKLLEMESGHLSVLLL